MPNADHRIPSGFDAAERIRPHAASGAHAGELGAGRLVLFTPEAAEELTLALSSMDGGTVATCLRWSVLRRRGG